MSFLVVRIDRIIFVLPPDAASRPNEKVLDESLAPILDTFKASYGGDQEDDVPAAGAKRSAGSSVRRSCEKSTRLRLWFFPRPMSKAVYSVNA